MPAPPTPPGPPHNPGLLQLIEAKREWHWRPTPDELRRGFRGWHERGYLPHFDAPRITQLVTFMLNDSFPITRRTEWEPYLKEPDTSTRRRKLEAWLDRGHGECWLRRPAIADAIRDVLRAGDGPAYRLRAWVIMPNHVHFIVDVQDVPLAKLVNTWKGKSARAANKLLGRVGPFWQADYYDTLIRNEAHLCQAKRYVEANPVKAGLAKEVAAWPWSSACGQERGIHAAETSLLPLLSNHSPLSPSHISAA